ncbi:MAG: hypothetical protein WDN00_13665 [Limisphaerales bacterium]
MGKFGDMHASTEKNFMVRMLPQQLSGLHHLKVHLPAEPFNAGGKTAADMVGPQVEQGKRHEHDGLGTTIFNFRNHAAHRLAIRFARCAGRQLQHGTDKSPDQPFDFSGQTQRLHRPKEFDQMFF